MSNVLSAPPGADAATLTGSISVSDVLPIGGIASDSSSAHANSSDRIGVRVGVQFPSNGAALLWAGAVVARCEWGKSRTRVECYPNTSIAIDGIQNISPVVVQVVTRPRVVSLSSTVPVGDLITAVYATASR